jgi:hypothetical protein
MSLSARVPSGADTYKFIPKMYSNKVIDAAKSQLVCWDAVDSSWESDLKKGDVLYISKTNTVTATEVVVGTKANSLNPYATAAVTLTIDQWYEAPVDLDYMTLRQTHIQMEDKAVAESAYAIKVAMDSYIAGLFSTLNGSSVQGTDGAAITDDLLLDMLEDLNEANVPMDGQRSLILDPSGLTDLMKIDKFIAQQYANNVGAVSNGVIGKSPIYGCTVRLTNNLTAASVGSYGAILHKKAIGAAAQIDKAWTKEYEDLHLRRYQAEALWGAVEVLDNFGIPFYTRHA